MNDSGTNGKVFNIGSGGNYSVNEIYKMISELLGIKISPIHKVDLPGEASVTLADITEAKKLGWEPQADIVTGLKNMIEYIKKEIETGKIR